VSKTIPLSGWGEIDLQSYRKDIEPTFTTDARPFADLVDTVYQSLQARYSSGAKHIPHGLFRYYCFTMWWVRALWLHKHNGNTLDTEQKNFLNIVSAGEEFQVPSPIAQYLSNMGNFLQGGELYYFRLLSTALGDAGDGVVQKGWIETDDDNNRVTDRYFWRYAQIPSPAVYVSYLCNEAESTLPQPGPLLNLGAVAPNNSGRKVYPTNNIVGWSNQITQATHSSWRSTYANLGWSGTGLAPDVQTQFLVSTSTLKWVSERLASVRDYKVFSSKQITLSTQGHPMQAYFLGTEVPASQASQFPAHADVANNHLCGSRFSDLAVLSRYGIDSKVLAPAFSFGYRIERSKVFRNYAGGQPTYSSESNYQPWILANDTDTNRVLLTAAQLQHINEPFVYGSQPFFNVRRFATHELSRTVGLDAALVLSDTK